MSFTHVVEQGECLNSIALRFGFKSFDQLYDHPSNAALKKKRPNPSVILPGDEVVIPDRQARIHSGATNQVHHLEVRPPEVLLRLALVDSDGKPMAGESYTLEVGERVYKGKTNADGLLEEHVASEEPEGVLTLEARGQSWCIRVGELDPVHDEGADAPIITGIQARLGSLGLYAGAVNGTLDDETMQALREFQAAVLDRKDPDGLPDKRTRDALLEAHGC